MSYARSIHRLRALTLAHNALTEVLESATEDMLHAAAAEAGTPTVARPVTAGSGLRQRVTTDMVHRQIRSADIERYIKEAWTRAQTDEARLKVREMVLSANASLDEEASLRIRRLIA